MRGQIRSDADHLFRAEIPEKAEEFGNIYPEF
jgi:hypothetical protein